MNTITKSSLFFDEFDQLTLVTQGSVGYTLVAQKKALFRLFLDVSPASNLAVIATIMLKIGPFSIEKNFLIPSNSLFIETTAPHGPSVGILFAGDVFSFPGRYEVEFFVIENLSTKAHFKITELVFLRPGNLHILIHNLEGTAPWGTVIKSDIFWLDDMVRSLERFAAMLPVRDGIRLGLHPSNRGICFSFGSSIDPWDCPSGNAPPCTEAEVLEVHLKETKEINAGGIDRVDATVSWRPRDLLFPAPGGEGVGGKARFYDVPNGTGLAGFVGGRAIFGREMTAPLLAQEVGHLFGLEPKDSPHFQDPLDGLHSKDRMVIDPFAFDFVLLKPYQPPQNGFIGDVMNNFGGGISQGRDMVLYNAFDWEHMRKRLPPAPVSFPFIAADKQPTKKQQDELVNEWNKTYAEVTQINVANPGKVLTIQEGSVWNWTPDGFQMVQKGKAKKTRSGLSPSVEGIQYCLEDLGISEVYTPVGDRSLSMVISPNTSRSLRGKEFDVF
jgi:hypothetical protein